MCLSCQYDLKSWNVPNIICKLPKNKIWTEWNFVPIWCKQTKTLPKLHVNSEKSGLQSYQQSCFPSKKYKIIIKSQLQRNVICYGCNNAQLYNGFDNSFHKLIAILRTKASKIIVHMSSIVWSIFLCRNTLSSFKYVLLIEYAYWKFYYIIMILFE